MRRSRAFGLLLVLALATEAAAMPETPPALRDRAAVERQKILKQLDRLTERESRYWEALRADVDVAIHAAQESALAANAETERQLEEMRRRLERQERTLLLGLAVIGGWLSLFGFRLWRLQAPGPLRSGRRMTFVPRGATRR
ncbi:MAG: hypothetical protein ACREQ9_03740 [Candidatus Binatia bacterium]